MAGWREKKRKMLGDVHRHFEIPAVYLTHATGTPLPITVRLHRKQIVERPPLAMSDEVAGMLDIHDRIIFQRSQLPPDHDGVFKDAYVIFGGEEAYRTGASKPERETYIWVEVSPVSQKALDLLVEQVDLRDSAWEGILT